MSAASFHSPSRRPSDAPPALVFALGGLLASGAICIGCGDNVVQPTWQPEDRGTSVTNVSGESVANDQVGPQNPVASAASSQALATFKPVYPDRKNPFEFDDVAQAPAAVETAAANIRVMGFVDVGDSKVILSIDKRTHIVGPGDQVGGIKIVDVNAPSVRLQNLYRTWSISLFDARDEIQ